MHNKDQHMLSNGICLGWTYWLQFHDQKIRLSVCPSISVWGLCVLVLLSLCNISSLKVHTVALLVLIGTAKFFKSNYADKLTRFATLFVHWTGLFHTSITHTHCIYLAQGLLTLSSEWTDELNGFYSSFNASVKQSWMAILYNKSNLFLDHYLPFP